MPPELLLHQLVDHLKPVHGLRAIVLGGSYASGAPRPDSDIDIGLYYDENQPLDIGHVRSIASRINDAQEPTVTDLGGWGTWVNGGAWLSIEGQRVDFLYRDIDFVSSTIDDCNAGQIRSDYWQQPAYGFYSFMYCAETVICRPLYDPDQVIERLKAKVAHYSPHLKQAIIKNFLWSARLKLAADLCDFSLQPANFLERISTLLGATGTTSAQLQASLAQTEALYNELATLAKERQG